MTSPLAMCNPTTLQVVMTRCKRILFSSKKETKSKKPSNLVISKEARLASRRHVPIHMRRPLLNLKKEVSKEQKTTTDRLCLLAATSVTPLITYQKIVNSLANAVCERVGHKEKCCFRKKPNANLAETDGYDVYANMICVQEKKILMKKKFRFLCCSTNPPPGYGERNISR